jgi:hypothetical protein
MGDVNAAGQRHGIVYAAGANDYRSPDCCRDRRTLREYTSIAAPGKGSNTDPKHLDRIAFLRIALPAISKALASVTSRAQVSLVTDYLVPIQF